MLRTILFNDRLKFNTKSFKWKFSLSTMWKKQKTLHRRFDLCFYDNTQIKARAKEREREESILFLLFFLRELYDDRHRYVNLDDRTNDSFQKKGNHIGKLFFIHYHSTLIDFWVERSLLDVIRGTNTCFKSTSKEKQWQVMARLIFIFIIS